MTWISNNSDPTFSSSRSGYRLTYLSTHSSTSAMAATGSHTTTPLKQGVSTGSFHAAEHLLGDRMRREIGNYRHSNIDLLDFAEHVWGLNRKNAETILSHTYVLDSSALKTYGEVDHETKLHAPFTKMTNDLLSDVHTLLNESPATPAVGLWDKQGKEVLKGPRQRKPDMLNVWAPVPDNPSWATVKHVWEMKRPPPKKKNGGKDLFKEAVTAGSTGEKRQRDPDSDSEPEKRRRLEEPILEAHLQLASYALECLASTSRYFMTGMLVNMWVVTVCYIDRTLVLRVEQFDFKDAPQKLALAVYAMYHSNRLHSGFDPRLRASPSGNVSTRGRKLQEDLPVNDPIGSYFEFEPQSDGKEHIADSKPAPSRCFRVSDVIRMPDDLISRGTTVYKVQKLGEDGKLSAGEYALKLSWPLKKRVSEIEVVKQLKTKLPVAVHDHLPNVTFSATFTAKQMGLPWTKLSLELNDKNHQERVLRGLVVDHYLKLWEAGSVEAFQEAWLDCVECHHLAWKTGRVLHRDLSENNLMLYLKDDKVKGILNDWDMATLVDAVDDKLSAAHHRTGTPPFMAMDLLVAQPPVHWYRHDLESLFYILLWGALHYDLKAKMRLKRIHPSLKEWMGSMSANMAAKNLMFTRNAVAEDIFEQIKRKPEFVELVDKWLRPLHRLFKRAQASDPDESGDPDPNYEHETFGGRLTFETFMKTIGRVPRWA